MLIALIKLTVQEGGDGGLDGEVSGEDIGHPCPTLSTQGLKICEAKKGERVKDIPTSPI